MVAPGGGTVTLSGDHGVYRFDSAACLGSKSVADKLVMTAVGDGDRTSAVITLDGGKFSFLLSPGGTTAEVWTGQAAVGAAASRGQDSVRLDGLPVATTTLAGEISGVTASGTLTCSNSTAMS